MSGHADSHCPCRRMGHDRARNDDDDCDEQCLVPGKGEALTRDDGSGNAYGAERARRTKEMETVEDVLGHNETETRKKLDCHSEDKQCNDGDVAHYTHRSRK
jgi:hypothetical protein